MRRIAAVLFLAALTSAGCGRSSSKGLTLDSLLKRPGPDVAVTPRAGDFVPGRVRFPFLVIASDGRPVERATARVWVATGRDEAPFATTTARLEPVGIPDRSEAAAGGVRKIYVARFDVPRPGRYWLVTRVPPAGQARLRRRLKRL